MTDADSFKHIYGQKDLNGIYNRGCHIT